MHYGAHARDGEEYFKEAVGQMMELEVGPTVFQVGVLRQDRAFCLHWTGMTNVRNVIWMRFVAFRLRWPPVKSLSCFTFAREPVSVERKLYASPEDRALILYLRA